MATCPKCGYSDPHGVDTKCPNCDDAVLELDEGELLDRALRHQYGLDQKTR